MRKLQLFLIFTAIASLHQSCSEDNSNSLEMENIQIPFAKVEVLDINEGKVIPLETKGEESMISSITNIEAIQDTLVILSTHSISKFDESGHFLGTIGAVGHASSEYTDTRSMFISDRKIHVFDWGGRKINTYDPSGNFLSKQDINSNENNIYPSSLFRTNEGSLLSVNCYQGQDVLTPAFSIFSSSGDLAYDIKGMYKKDGTTRNELRFSPSTNTLLYAEAFNDTIYRVMLDKAEAVKAYYIDYGEYKFTEAEKSGKNFVEMCQYSNKEEFIKTKAGPIFCCYETEEEMMFVFIFQKKLHFVRYDKNDKAPRVFRLEDKTGHLEANLFVAYTKDNVFFSCVDTKSMVNNPILVKFSFEKFNK